MVTFLVLVCSASSRLSRLWNVSGSPPVGLRPPTPCAHVPEICPWLSDPPLDDLPGSLKESGSHEEDEVSDGDG